MFERLFCALLTKCLLLRKNKGGLGVLIGSDYCSFSLQETGSSSIGVIFTPLLKCRLLMCMGIAWHLSCHFEATWVLYKCNGGGALVSALPGENSFASGVHRKQWRGEITARLCKCRRPVIFHGRAEESEVFSRQETSAKVRFTSSVFAWAH